MVPAGLLLEINRRILWPLGLALAVEGYDEGGEMRYAPMIYGTNDPEARKIPILSRSAMRPVPSKYLKCEVTVNGHSGLSALS